MEQMNIKVEPETHNDDTQQTDKSKLGYGGKIEIEIKIENKAVVKEEPISDEECSELIDDPLMCGSTSQISDGVAMHIKEEPAADVGYDEPAPLLVTQLTDTRLHLIGPCAGYVRLANIMWPAHPAAQQECLHCCNPVNRQTASGPNVLPAPIKDEVESTILSVKSVHKQQVVPSGLSTDDVCVSGNSDCTRQVNAKERAKCTASGNTYQCDVCNKTFSEESDLKSHFRNHTGKKPYQCDLCNKNFSQQFNLKRHIRTHTGEKPYQCDICNMTFSEESYLKRHFRNHTGKKPYQCDLCNKNFSQQFNLKRHIRSHTGEKPYECDLCNKTFSIRSNLKSHIRTHTGEKPFQCDICNKIFSNQSYLKRHIRTHTGEKPYKCDLCYKTFSQQGHLKTHTSTHTSKKPYQCDLCNKTFSVQSSLNRHILTHTS